LDNKKKKARGGAKHAKKTTSMAPSVFSFPSSFLVQYSIFDIRVFPSVRLILSIILSKTRTSRMDRIDMTDRMKRD